MRIEDLKSPDIGLEVVAKIAIGRNVKFSIGKTNTDGSYTCRYSGHYPISPVVEWISFSELELISQDFDLNDPLSAPSLFLYARGDAKRISIKSEAQANIEQALIDGSEMGCDDLMARIVRNPDYFISTTKKGKLILNLRLGDANTHSGKIRAGNNGVFILRLDIIKAFKAELKGKSNNDLIKMAAHILSVVEKSQNKAA